MTKYEKASCVIEAQQGVSTWYTKDATYVSVWNAELTDTFDVCIHENEVSYYAKLYDNQKQYARKCCITGEGMNEGYCIEDGLMYVKYEKDMIKHLRKLEKNSNAEEIRIKRIEEDRLTDEFLLQDYYKAEYYYYTEWVDEEDYEFIEYGGQGVHRKELFNNKRD